MFHEKEEWIRAIFTLGHKSKWRTETESESGQGSLQWCRCLLHGWSSQCCWLPCRKTHLPACDWSPGTPQRQSELILVWRMLSWPRYSETVYSQTRVLVTHGISHLPQMDLIVVMKDGRVTECGSYQCLVQKKGPFAEFIIQFLSQEKEDDAEGTSLQSTSLLFPRGGWWRYFFATRFLQKMMWRKSSISWRISQGKRLFAERGQRNIQSFQKAKV